MKAEDFGHVLYTDEDFTDIEIANSKLAQAVIDGGLAVCKLCGEYEAGLYTKHCNPKRRKDYDHKRRC